MAVNYSTVAEKIFRVLKGSGYSIQMFDDTDGNEISNPEEARFFYVNQPNIMVNLSPENEEIKMHKGPENIEEIEKSVLSIKNLAKDNLLDFDLREFGREIKPKNYAFRLNSNSMSDENIKTEGYSSITGTIKTSNQKLEGAKLLIKHRKPVDEEVPGSRSRNIKALYIENADGERFKYPFIHLNGARAMTRHVQAGGNPFDEVGQSITNISERLSKIREVLNVIRRSPAIQEQAGSVINSLTYNQDRLRETIKRLMTGTGYESYVENYKKSEAKEFDQNTLDSMKEKFTVTNIENRISDLLPMIQEIHDEEMNDTESLRKRVQAKLNDPVELGPRTASQQEFNPEKIQVFKDPRTKHALRLSDLAGRVKDDEISVFLSRISDKLSGFDQEKETVEDIKTVTAILDVIKEPKEVEKVETTNTEVREIQELNESFDTILGIYNPASISEDPADFKTVMSYTGQDSGSENTPMSYDAWLKKEKGIERGARGVSWDQHNELSKEWRNLKKADKIGWKSESDVEEAPKPDFLDLDKDGNKIEPMKKAAKEDEEEFTQADADAEHFGAMQDYEDYRDAVMQDIQDEKGSFAGKSDVQIAQELRKEADGIGYGDVASGGDRNPSEPTWLKKIADELDGTESSENKEEANTENEVPASTDGEATAPTDLDKVILRIQNLAGIK